MAFAIGWTPCICPVLGAILTAAATVEGVWRGAALLFVYSLGLGIPFGRAIELAGGGVAHPDGRADDHKTLVQLFAPLLRLFSRSGWPPA